MLEVIAYSHIKNGRTFWLCLCRCGREKVIARANLIKKNPTNSCGCKVKYNSRKHEFCNTRLYHIWENMKQRCLNSNNNNYVNYGGRGISICDEWKNSFMSFFNWAIYHGYDESLTLDRVNNDGDYEPSNCRWATKQEQSLNTRDNKGWFKKRSYKYKKK